MRTLIFDVGGTNIKFGLSEDGTTITSKGQILTEADWGFDSVVSKMAKIVQQFLPLDLIAVSQAGIVKEDSSILFANAKMVGFTGRSFKREIEMRFGIPTFTFNDAKAAANFVAKKIPQKEALLMVLGTGLGVSLIVNSKVFMTASGITGEMGINFVEGKPLDDHLSLTNLNRRLQASNCAVKFENYDQAKDECKQIFDDYLKTLGRWVYNAYATYGIETIYLGGSMPAFNKKVLDEVKHYALAYSFDLSKNIRLDFPPSGEDANMLGALYWAEQKLKETKG